MGFSGGEVGCIVVARIVMGGSRFEIGRLTSLLTWKESWRGGFLIGKGVDWMCEISAIRERRLKGAFLIWKVLRVFGREPMRKK